MLSLQPYAPWFDEDIANTYFFQVIDGGDMATKHILVFLDISYRVSYRFLDTIQYRFGFLFEIHFIAVNRIRSR